MLREEILESWDRQTQILTNLASLVNESNRKALPSPDGMPLDAQLAHVHIVRWGWLHEISPKHTEVLGRVFKPDTREAIDDLDEIKHQLDLSAKAVRDAFSEALDAGAERIGPYTHPLMFLQHMVWHEGYHFALISLALRLAGQEPSEEWEELNVWGIWRDPEI